MRLCRWVTTLLVVLAGFGQTPVPAQDRIQILPQALRFDAPHVRATAQQTPERLAAFEQPSGGEPAVAKPPAAPGMALAELEAIALEHNPTLVQASAAVQATEGQRWQAGLYPNPVIGYVGEEMGDEGTAGQQGAFFAQELVTAGKLRLRRAVAGHEVEQARHALEAQRQRVLNDVRAGYYEVLLAQRVVELDQELVRIGEEGVDAAKQLEAALEVGRAHVLQARIEAESAGLELHNAQNRYWAAWQRLATVLGMPQMEPPALAGQLEDDLPKLTWENAFARLMAASPELARARAGVERARCALAWEHARRIPNVDVEAGVRYSNTSRDTLTTVQVGVPLPLFDRNQGNICAAEAGLVAARNEIRRVELELHRRLVDAFQAYANARHQVETYSARILPNAKASLELVQTARKRGEFDYFTLLTAQRTYFRVNLAYVESLYRLRASSVNIEGMLLRGALEQGSASSGYRVD